ncbi:MAG: prepilin-type N-terminal cleavage/methylation domain-containing protein [Campylobacterota bacterium]
MTKAFSLLELIIAVLIISIITAFIASKYTDLLSNANITKLKADVALIRSGISTLKQEKILLQDSSDITSLDDESVQSKNKKLFSKILSNPLLSTTTALKEDGKWFKDSSFDYGYFISSKEVVFFKYENSMFNCKKPVSLCQELF